MHALGSADDISKHVQYTQMQPGSMESMSSMYSVSSGSLPSQFRSINLKPEVHFTVEPETYKPNSCSTRTVYIILAAIFIVTSSVAIAIVAHEIHVIQNEPEEYQAFLHSTNTSRHKDETTATEQDAKIAATQPTPTKHSSRTPVPPYTDPRTPCYKQCTVYNEAKFQSRCIAGFCSCSGRDYQKTTCLPTVDECLITKSAASNMTFMWGQPTMVYTCQRLHTTAADTQRNEPAESVKTYAIGIYGNHFSEATEVIFYGSGTNEHNSLGPIRLVLASHYPIRWKITSHNISLHEIVLVNDNTFSKSEVYRSQDEDAASATTTLHLTLPVGYGDDRHQTNTVEMIRTLTERYSRLDSFIGASFADLIILRLPN